MNIQEFIQSSLLAVGRLGLQIAGALALWLIGRRAIQFALRLTRRWLDRHLVDATLVRYMETATSVLLNVVLVVTILGSFGVQTTTFAAAIAAGGVAIGVAWGGLLANFAAGVFLVVLRPFKVGDAVTAGGVTGTVESIGLFGTVINSPDNVQTIVSNNKIFAETIQNFSANPYRRVDLSVTINNAVDHRDAIRLLKFRLSQIPHVLPSPEPEVDILQLTPAGPLLCVRPCCSNAHYGQVYFDTIRMIREAFNEAGFPVAVQGLQIQTSSIDHLLGSQVTH
ncbi:MAG TPA: mechanosensitive ion channel family protein [Vicinamibacterales bacterium]|nr:mechanosensitive ion channel family protein [Vicinamibacterales bacterium]